MRDERPSRVESPECGVVAVVVALMLLVLVGVASLAIDVGAAWMVKRDLVVGLDSAALAGAGSIPAGGPRACEEDVDLVADAVVDAGLRNGTRIARDDIEVRCDTGVVQVAASAPSVGVFSGIFGVGEVRPSGRSAAVVDVDAARVMPVGICVEALEKPDAPVSAAPGGSEPALQRFVLGAGDLTGGGCSDPADGGVTGSWLDLAGPDQGAADLRQQIEVGYPGPLVVGDGGAMPAQCGAADQRIEGVCHRALPGPSATAWLGEAHACDPDAADVCRVLVFVVYRDQARDGGGAPSEDDAPSGTLELAGLLAARLWKVDAREAWVVIEPLEYVEAGSPRDLASASERRLRMCRADAVTLCPGAP